MNQELIDAVNGFIEKVKSDEVGPYVKPLAVELVKGDRGVCPSVYDSEIAKNKLHIFKQLVKRRGLRYADCTTSNFTTDTQSSVDAIAAVVNFIGDMQSLLRQGQGNLVFIGPAGTGKDHLLMACMREAVLRYGYGVHWIDGMDFFAQCKNNNFEDTEQLFRECCWADILAISDPVPPVGELSHYDLTMLRRIVEKRYSRGQAIWVTTNVGCIEDAERLFTAAVLSRLIDGATQVLCNWDSYRKLRK